MVMMESLSTGHKRVSFRDKTAEKKEIVAFDPTVQLMSVYKEVKKIRTMRGKFDLAEDYLTPRFNENGDLCVQRKRRRRIPVLDESKSSTDWEPSLPPSGH